MLVITILVKKMLLKKCFKKCSENEILRRENVKHWIRYDGISTTNLKKPTIKIELIKQTGIKAMVEKWDINELYSRKYATPEIPFDGTFLCNTNDNNKNNNMDKYIYIYIYLIILIIYLNNKLIIYLINVTIFANRD